MHRKTNKKPKIRFREFDLSWYQIELKEIVERVTRKNSELVSTLPLTISAQDGLIDQNKYFNKQIASKDVSGYFLVKNGEFAYNKSYSNGYPLGAIKRLDNYDMGVLSTLYIVFKPTNVNSQFLVSYYDTNYWHKEVSSYAAEGARNHGLLNISSTDFFRTLLIIPKQQKEQEKIGSFFKQLNETIDLQQQDLDNYKQLKKVMLQRMFPKKNDKIPQIRFDKYTNTWEQRKLKDVVKNIGTGRSSFKKKEISKDNSFAILGSTGIIGYDDDYDHEGDFILTARVGANAGSLYKHSGQVKITDNTVFIECENLYFLYNLLEKFDIKRLSFGTGQPLVKTSELKKITLNFPLAEEQQKIGSLFKKIDDTIALHQSKLDSYKELKEAMLQRMFI